MDEVKKRKAGRTAKGEKKRTHCVSSRFSREELIDLDKRRGDMQRGDYLRRAALGALPKVVPAINREAWLDLGRACGNLATVAGAMRGGEYVELPEILKAVRTLRSRLMGFEEPESDGEA